MMNTEVRSRGFVQNEHVVVNDDYDDDCARAQMAQTLHTERKQRDWSGTRSILQFDGIGRGHPIRGLRRIEKSLRFEQTIESHTIRY